VQREARRMSNFFDKSNAYQRSHHQGY